MSMSIIFFLGTMFYRKRSLSTIKDDSNADQRIKIMKSYYRLHPAKIAIVVSAMAILFIVVKFSFGFTRHSFDQAFENLAWFNRDWEIALVYLVCLVYTLNDHNKKYRTLQKIGQSYSERTEDFLPA